MPKQGETRAPHKEDCQCVVCKSVRAKVAREAQPEPVPVAEPAPVMPSVVSASSLKSGNLFELNGKTYRAGSKETEFILCMNIAEPGVAPLTLGLNAMVKLKN